MNSQSTVRLREAHGIRQSRVAQGQKAARRADVSGCSLARIGFAVLGGSSAKASTCAVPAWLAVATLGLPQVNPRTFQLGHGQQAARLRLVSLRVRDVYQGSAVSTRAIVMQRKTQRPVQFEITEAARESIAVWVARSELRSSSYLFPGRGDEHHLSVRQYSRIVKGCTSCNEAGKHRQAPGHRSGRRPRDLRADRDLGPVSARSSHLRRVPLRRLETGSRRSSLAP
jgi:hypothetical protein